VPDMFALRIATPEEVLLDEEVLSLRAPAVEGQLGVLAKHAPMVAELTIGGLTVTDQSGNARYFATTGGVLRVERDAVIVLGDAAEEADKIEIERAHTALARAQRRLRQPPGAPGIDLLRAELALARALNRLRVAERAGASG
jgi:F-type H+-transporting ATPase subunit epsilon